MRQLYVAAYHAVVTDNGITAKDSRAGIYDDMITNIGVTLNPFYRVSVFVKLKALRAECHSLIKLDMIAYGAGFTDDDAGSMVDKKMFSDYGSGVYVYTRDTVGIWISTVFRSVGVGGLSGNMNAMLADVVE